MSQIAWSEPVFALVNYDAFNGIKTCYQRDIKGRELAEESLIVAIRLRIQLRKVFAGIFSASSSQSASPVTVTVSRKLSLIDERLESSGIRSLILRW